MEKFKGLKFNNQRWRAFNQQSGWKSGMRGEVEGSKSFRQSLRAGLE